MDSILLIGEGSGDLKRLKSHLLKSGFHVVHVEPDELKRLEESKGRFLLGVVGGAGAVRLPEMVQRIRQQSPVEELPLLALVERPNLKELGQVQGLDDFLLAPAIPEEVEARLRFILKRLNHLAPGDGIRRGDLELNVDRYEVLLDGEPLELTYKEFELLKFLATHPGRVFSRDQLLNQVWGYNFIGGTRTVDVHIRRLRAKLGPKHASLIDTVRNVGYKFLETL